MAHWKAVAPGVRWADVFDDDDSLGAECLACTMTAQAKDVSVLTSQIPVVKAATCRRDQ